MFMADWMWQFQPFLSSPVILVRPFHDRYSRKSGNPLVIAACRGRILLALLSRVRKAIVKRQQRGSIVALGTVKWFNSQKGSGFIQPQGGGKDVFVYISAVEKAGLTTLNEGQQIQYEEVSNRGKTLAENLKVK
jgi:CspA family cold shock protein